MFLLSVDDEDRIPGLRTRLVESWATRSRRRWRRRVERPAHVDDPGAAVEAGVDSARTEITSPGSSLTMDWPPTPTTMPTAMPTATPTPMSTRNSTRNSAMMPTAMVTSRGRGDRDRRVCRRGRAGVHLHQGRCGRHLLRAGPPGHDRPVHRGHPPAARDRRPWRHRAPERLRARSSRQRRPRPRRRGRGHRGLVGEPGPPSREWRPWRCSSRMPGRPPISSRCSPPRPGPVTGPSRSPTGSV